MVRTARTYRSFLAMVLVLIAILLALAHRADAASPAQDTSYYPPGETKYGFVPLADFSGSPRLSDVYNSPDLSTFIGKLFYGAIALGGILAVLRLAYAGFSYITTDLPGVKSNAKDIIWETLLGLFLLLGIYVILKQINPEILNLNVDIKPPPTSTTPASNVQPSQN